MIDAVNYLLNKTINSTQEITNLINLVGDTLLSLSLTYRTNLTTVSNAITLIDIFLQIPQSIITQTQTGSSANK